VSNEGGAEILGEMRADAIVVSIINSPNAKNESGSTRENDS
jgi:hypothetical protein